MSVVLGINCRKLVSNVRSVKGAKAVMTGGGIGCELNLNHFNLRVVLQGQACLRDGVCPVRRVELKGERGSG